MSVSLISMDSKPPSPFERSDIYHKMACINHISRDTCDVFGRENVQLFIDKFSLYTYQDFKYCPHTVIRYFLEATWFPFHLLPGCIKLDQYLAAV